MSVIECDVALARPPPRSASFHHHHQTLITIYNADVVATALASAANGSEECAVHLRIAAKGGAGLKDVPPFPGFETREGRDEARRLLDLAAQRITPSLDCRQYATSGRISFGADDLCVVSVTPTHRVNEGIPLTPHRSMFSDEPAENMLRRKGDKKRLRVAGLLAAALMCDAWSEHRAKDCVDAAATSRRPIVHIEPRGVALTLRLVAVSTFHGYVAARTSSAQESAWRVVAVIPAPSGDHWSREGVSAVAGDARPKRGRSDGQSEAEETASDVWMIGDVEFPACLRRTLESQHGKLVLSVLPATCRPLVEVVAHRLVIEPCPATAVALITAEDCHVTRFKGTTSSPTPADEEAHAITDLVALVRESSRSVLERVDAALQGTSAGVASTVPAAAVAEFKRLRKAMLDSMSVSFSKARGAKKLAIPQPLLGSSCATPVTADFHLVDDESSKLEFKHHLADEDAKASATMTGERLRRTIAAMASTEGGHILLGVADDGRLADRSALVSYVSSVRLGGFCPAMVKDAVTAVELPLRFSDAPAALPKDWWKTGAPAAATSALQQPAKDARRKDVLTMITVQQGTAPFYAPYRHGVPSMRGAASTVTMPTQVVVNRIAALLPSLVEGLAELGVDLAGEFARAAE